MKSHNPLNNAITIGAMILCAIFLIIPLVCMWTMFDDLLAGDLITASLKLMVSVISAIVGIVLAFFVTRHLR